MKIKGYMLGDAGHRQLQGDLADEREGRKQFLLEITGRAFFLAREGPWAEHP